MIFNGMDDERRSVLWRIVVLFASVIIMAVVVFFGVRLFTGNPLHGFWESEDSRMMIEFEDRDTVIATWEDADGRFQKVELEYRMDKQDKTVSVRPEEMEEDTGILADQGLEANFGLMTATFDYSVEGDTLTLTEREYGEQLVFKKK